jgi:hypothetical protein
MPNFILKGSFFMIKCSEKKDFSSILSTREQFELFKITEEKLAWYIKEATQALDYYLSNDQILNDEFVNLITPYQDVEFKPILKNKDELVVLVALDLKRIVLFSYIDIMYYEIWLKYEVTDNGYFFKENLYRLLITGYDKR